MNDIPAHRRGHEARSGDTHVIGADGKARNVDQEARAAAAGIVKAKLETKVAPQPILAVPGIGDGLTAPGAAASAPGTASPAKA